MSSDRAILLISDRPDRSRELARRLGRLFACRMIGLYEPQSTAEPVAAVVTDVGFRHPADIERLRHHLSQPRALAVPIAAILRDNSHLERVQAIAVGATCQSALDRDPVSASKRDPLVLRFERLAFAPSELAGVAETGRARVDV